MNLKMSKVLLYLGIVFLIVVAFLLALRNMSYFDIKKIDIRYTGPVEELGIDINRCIIPYKGLNLFNADLKHLEHSIGQFEGIDNVSVKRFFPDRLIIDINFKKYMAKINADYNNRKMFFLADTSGITEVSKETYDLFSLLAEVEISGQYAELLVKWGADNGFAQMCVLAENLGQKSLITSIKYDNNSSKDFGLMKIEMSSVQSVLFVREPVMPDRLSEAMLMISRNKNADGVLDRYDLYSNALIKRR